MNCKEDFENLCLPPRAQHSPAHMDSKSLFPLACPRREPQQGEYLSPEGGAQAAEDLPQPTPPHQQKKIESQSHTTFTLLYSIRILYY